MPLRISIIVLSVLCFGAGFCFALSRFVEMPERSVLRGWDNTFYYSWVRSLIKDGDLNFENEFKLNNTIADKDKNRLAEFQKLETGYYPNKYGIGWGLVTVPFFYCAELNSVFFSLLGIEHRSDGYGKIHQIWIQSGHLFLAVLSLFITYKITRNWFSPKLSAFGVLGAWGGSFLFYYQTVNLSMAHNLTYLLICAVYYFTINFRRKKEPLMLLPLMFFSGLLIVTRYQAGIFLLYPAIVLASCFLKNFAPFPVKTVCVGISLFLFPLILQAIAWKIIYGSWIVFSYGHENEYFQWFNIAGWSVLFSPNHGLFYWHPIFLFGFLGFTALILYKREWNLLSWGVAIDVTWYVTAAWWCWWLGSSFGQRNFEGAVLLTAVGLPFLYQKIRSETVKHLYLAVITILVVWNLNLCLLYTTNTISRNSGVSYGDMMEAMIKFVKLMSDTAYPNAQFL